MCVCMCVCVRALLVQLMQLWSPLLHWAALHHDPDSRALNSQLPCSPPCSPQTLLHEMIHAENFMVGKGVCMHACVLGGKMASRTAGGLVVWHAYSCEVCVPPPPYTHACCIDPCLIDLKSIDLWPHPTLPHLTPGGGLQGRA